MKKAITRNLLSFCLQSTYIYAIIARMVTTIDIKKNANENNASLLRRFTRRVQESGTIPKMKSLRYSERPKSKLSLKKNALKKLARRNEVEKLKKLGKFVEKKKGRGRGR